VKEFTNDNFEAEVLNDPGLVLVDFWAEWCVPCRMLAPTIDQIAQEYAGKVKVGKVDTDANQDTAVKYNINSIPTVILFQGGEVVKQFVGMTNKAKFDEALGELAGT
jgi:thioredoxin 1